MITSSGSTLKALLPLLSVTLIACAPDPGPAVVQVDEAPNVADAASAAPSPNSSSLVPPAGMAVPDVTVNALMKDTIDPAARQLWTAVSYTVSAEGTQETSPQSDADWNILRERAETLMKASVTLQLPGLRMHADPAAERPDFQFAPAQIEAARADNPVPWRVYAEQMQSTTLQILSAIERRDLLEYQALGVTLNGACEGCHGEYWYKPLPMRGAENIR